MKNEQRIIELLSEYLRKSDKHEEMFLKNQARIEENQARIRENQAMIRENQAMIRENQASIQETQDEIKDMRSNLLKQEIRNETLIKEVLHLSKRVLDIEEGR
ncbi:MAG: hypothetical protein AAF789_02005 [Bacteroidota bacterium]